MVFSKNTQMLTNSNSDIARAAALLKGGGLVAFPTETVYGLGANALDGQAINKIFEAKGRPSDNPLIIHIADINQLDVLVSNIPENAAKLIDAFWPGPLTIVMKKSEQVPNIVSAGLDTVGIRIPKNETALRLLRECAIPIAAPSANTSGKPSPTNANHVADDMNGRVDAIIDGGKCDVGVESSVIDVSGETPLLLRPGGITLEQLSEVLGKVEKNFEYEEGEPAPRSPGVKYTHYAPNADVIVVRGDFKKYVRNNADKYKKIGIISYDKDDYPLNCVALHFGDTPSEYASNLFEYLRNLDSQGVDVIFAQDIDCKGLNLATNNRLYKAAGYNIVQED